MPVNQELITKFQSEYQKLNPEQRQAVDTIEGPVMVIAGAGTGKTQTIALRIANILAKTQISPGAILCLTFTENAAINMRQRLLSIIGPSAYGIRIHTFHSFCNEVILTNPEHFIFASEIEPLEELEKLEIIQNLIENLPDGSLLKPWGDHFYYQREIISRLQTLKRENVDPDHLRNLIDDQQYFVQNAAPFVDQLRALRVSKNLESDVLSLVTQIQNIDKLSLPIASYLHLTSEFYHQGQFDIGRAKNPAINYKNELLKFFDGLVKSIPKQRELAVIFEQYQSELKKRGKYDFDDMILFVLNAFKNDKELLLSYQERFQYILVDEYQDTNTAQNQIIELLGSYFDLPNIFVVGDDDQSIFRFQGAAIENIFYFIQRYGNQLKKIVLKNNYRSHQLILDSSASVIKNNKSRISNLFADIDKSLIATKTYDPDPVNIFAAPSTLVENYFVAQKIRTLIDGGENPSEIAILYRNNNDINDLMELLDNFHISYRLESGSDVLDNPHIRQLIHLLTYIDNPNDDTLLFKLLTYPFLGINQVDLFKLVRYSQHQAISFSDLITIPENIQKISDSLKPATVRKLHNFIIRLSKARRWKEIYSLDRFFNRIIRKFKFLNFLLITDDVTEINCLNEFYSELKRLSVEKKFDLHHFVTRLNLLIENNLSLPVPPVDGDYSGSVRLMTVHKAKGLEFNHVFLLKVLDRKWGNNLNTSSLNLPLGILKTEASLMASVQDENEEERRLFYVALTRAKKQIYISYPTKTSAGRELLPSMFVAEIDPGLIQKIDFDAKLSHEAVHSMFPKDTLSPVAGPELKNFLQHYLKYEYKFNVTHLNSYLKCPLCFYYRTILRIPATKDKFASLGTAVHWALSYLLNQLRKNNVLISKDELLDAYKRRLLKENLTSKHFEETLKRGSDSLGEYYDHYRDDFSCDCITDYDFGPDHVYLENIPVTGKIDKVELAHTKTGDKINANVVDFKTGSPDSKSAEMKLGSDYYRQLVFYKLMAQADPHFKYHITSGTIDFVQKSKVRDTFVKKGYELSSADEAEIMALIKDTYRRILDLDFTPLDTCDDTNDLHRLVKTK